MVLDHNRKQSQVLHRAAATSDVVKARPAIEARQRHVGSAKQSRTCSEEPYLDSQPDIYFWARDAGQL